ncbi:MAG: cation diffusion facilitator family transporter [Oscillospiraceae bacterium]|nr:cation diffusion facilitator family transporter [Oscillospiraceae bacterium]
MNRFLIEKFVGKNLEPENLEVRRKCGVLSGIIGVFCNLMMFAGKVTVGVLSSSIAATADAFNNLSDAGSSIITLVCFRMASNPADKEHPFGHGRIEYVSGLIVSIAIILTGLSFIKSSVEKIFNPEDVGADLFSFCILGISVAVKLWLGFFNKKLSRIIDSTAMKATANDSFMDSISTITVIVGMLITRFFGIYLDPYAGLVVSVFIILTGTKTLKESLAPLLGQAPNLELVKKINNFVLAYPEVAGISDLMVHNYGPGWSVISLRIQIIANDIDIFGISEIIDDIEKSLAKKLNCCAVIRIEPVKIQQD